MDPKYSHTSFKSMADVEKVKEIVIAAPELRSLFPWHFRHSYRGGVQIHKQNLSIDFENIWNMCKMKDVEECSRHKLGIEDVKLGSMALVEFINSVLEAACIREVWVLYLHNRPKHLILLLL